MKKLSFYADLTDPLRLYIGENPEITGITSDSRSVKPGMLFVAKKGLKVDGNTFIPKALAAGAAAVLTDSDTAVPKGVPYILVEDAGAVLGTLVAASYDYPASAMKVVGVTGTNGKTTIATLLYRLFRQLGYHVGLLSTIENKIDDTTIPASHTTPDAEELQALLAQMREAGCAYVFMEVSSHAVDQGRIAGIDFQGAVFTNLTRDHLDYHGTFLNYLNAKKKFFDQLSPSAFALVNVDDKNGMTMVQNTQAKVRSYALHNIADYTAKILDSFIDSTQLLINETEVSVYLVGEYNIYNFLAIYGVAVELGIAPSEALLAASKLKAAAGRFETIALKNGATAVVDYAHTPDALQNILSTLKPLVPSGSKLIALVGAGGDRDKGKRPQMAAVGEQLADKLILTSDNPRTEDPRAIIEDMKVGLSHPAEVLSITDRREAIRAGIQFSSQGDIILIAGKGHETYQEICGVRHHFDDREEVRAMNETMNA